MAKIYIAGASSEYARVREIMGAARAQYHEITFDWTRSVERLVLANMSEASLFDDEASASVATDLDGVRACDTFVLVVPRSTVITWGAPIEMGYAYALHKRILILGRLTGIFRTLGERVANESALLLALGGAQ